VQHQGIQSLPVCVYIPCHHRALSASPPRMAAWPALRPGRRCVQRVCLELPSSGVPGAHGRMCDRRLATCRCRRELMDDATSGRSASCGQRLAARPGRRAAAQAAGTCPALRSCGYGAAGRMAPSSWLVFTRRGVTLAAPRTLAQACSRRVTSWLTAAGPRPLPDDLGSATARSIITAVSHSTGCPRTRSTPEQPGCSGKVAWFTMEITRQLAAA